MEQIRKDPGDVFCEKFGSGCGDEQQRGTAIARTLAETVPRHEAVVWTMGHRMRS
jgi:hypothetical protein